MEKIAKQVWTWCLLRNAPSLRRGNRGTHTRALYFLLLPRISFYPRCLRGLKSSYSAGCYRQGYHLWGCNDGLSERTMGVSLTHKSWVFENVLLLPSACLVLPLSTSNCSTWCLFFFERWWNQRAQICEATVLTLKGRASDCTFQSWLGTSSPGGSCIF